MATKARWAKIQIDLDNGEVFVNGHAIPAEVANRIMDAWMLAEEWDDQDFDRRQFKWYIVNGG